MRVPTAIQGTVFIAIVLFALPSHWPEVEIWIRADSGFAREAIPAWCEAHDVEYVLGFARNKRLVRAIGGELEAVREEAERTGEKARCFRDLRYRTRKSWSRERRVVAKAEQLGKRRRWRSRRNSRNNATIESSHSF